MQATAMCMQACVAAAPAHAAAASCLAPAAAAALTTTHACVGAGPPQGAVPHGDDMAVLAYVTDVSQQQEQETAASAEQLAAQPGEEGLQQHVGLGEQAGVQAAAEPATEEADAAQDVAAEGQAQAGSSEQSAAAADGAAEASTSPGTPDTAAGPAAQPDAEHAEAGTADAASMSPQPDHPPAASSAPIDMPGESSAVASSCSGMRPRPHSLQLPPPCHQQGDSRLLLSVCQHCCRPGRAVPWPHTRKMPLSTLPRPTCECRGRAHCFGAACARPRPQRPGSQRACGVTRCGWGKGVGWLPLAAPGAAALDSHASQKAQPGLSVLPAAPAMPLCPPSTAGAHGWPRCQCAHGCLVPHPVPPAPPPAAMQAPQAARCWPRP